MTASSFPIEPALQASCPLSQLAFVDSKQAARNRINEDAFSTCGLPGLACKCMLSFRINQQALTI